MRFSKSVKNLITALYVINVLLVLPVTLFIPALALAQVTNINLHIINMGCVTVCVIYTMLVRMRDVLIQGKFEEIESFIISGRNKSSGLDRRRAGGCYGGIDHAQRVHGSEISGWIIEGL